MRKRRTKTRPPKGTIVGIAWYSASEWDRLKEVVPDPDHLEPTHEEWESAATKGLADLKKLGVDARRVPVGVEELLAWCKAAGREPDSRARAQFAAEQLRAGNRADLPDPPPPDRDPSVPKMPSIASSDHVRIGGKPLVCQHCGSARFHERRAHLNPAVLSFFDLDTPNKSPTVFVCRNCGFLHWFLPSAAEAIECLSCGRSISPGARTCDHCGWSYA